MLFSSLFILDSLQCDGIRSFTPTDFEFSGEFSLTLAIEDLQ